MPMWADVGSEWLLFKAPGVANEHCHRRFFEVNEITVLIQYRTLPSGIVSLLVGTWSKKLPHLSEARWIG